MRYSTPYPDGSSNWLVICDSSRINNESSTSMASTNHNTNGRVESAIPMARFSIGEDDDDVPVVFKRPRLAETASQSQPRSQRSVRSQPLVLEDEDDEEEPIPIEDVESDSQGLEEEEEDEEDEFEVEVEAEAEDDEEEEEEEEDAGSDEYDVQLAMTETGLEGQDPQEQVISPVGSSHLGLPNITVGIRSFTTTPPVIDNAIGALQVVLTDPDVLDCPICLDPLNTPVFQCENGHIACSSCCPKVKRKCPSCCMPIGYNRCRAIEKVLESAKVSCKNARYGCKETIPYSKKIDHEQTCPHTTCFCPHRSCPFAGSSKNLYLHFGVQHAASTTRFTYNTTFTARVEINMKSILLQEQHESVIFIINHEVKGHGRVFNVDCVGPSMLKTRFLYQLTAKHMETALSLQSVPEVYAKWSEHSLRKNYLIVPSEFSGYNGVMSLQVCIKKVAGFV